MALGPCQYMTCRSALGTAFRARFRLPEEDRWGDREVLLCSEHEGICSQARKTNKHMALTPESAVYLVGWMDSL